LYEAILAAKPTSDLAVALRDGVAYDKLKDQGRVQVATAVVLFAKGMAKLEEDAKAMADKGAAETASEATATPPAKPAETKKK
jgi:hypothetical protein